MISYTQHESQIERCMRYLIQIPGSCEIDILDLSHMLQGMLKIIGISISLEQAYRKVVFYLNKI